jgi:hypothetical protein
MKKVIAVVALGTCILWLRGTTACPSASIDCTRGAEFPSPLFGREPASR